MITEQTKLGDTVTNLYGDTGVIVGETSGGYGWVVEYRSGRRIVAHKIMADTVVITGVTE
jgi:hypothetical protein